MIWIFIFLVIIELTKKQKPYNVLVNTKTKKCGANNVPGLFGASSKKRKHSHY